MPGPLALLPILLAPLLSFPGARASCFGRDAHFKKLVAPVVVQPVRSDPTKLLVSWDQAIERPQCVDSYYVRVWAEGTNMTLGARVAVIEKDTVKNQVVLTKTVTIEPCVNYRILVELEELDSVSGKDLERTAEAKFRSQGVAAVVPGNTAGMVSATYLWDPVREVVDLSQAVISIPKEAVTNPNCLEYVQVTGAEVISSPPLSRGRPSTRGTALHNIPKGCQSESVNYQNRVRAEVIPNIQSWAACSQRCSQKASCKAWSWNRASAPKIYRLKCALMEGYSNSAADSNTVSGPRDCKPTPSISVGPASTLPAPVPGRTSYSSVAGGSARPSSSSPRITFPKPAFAYALPRTRKGAARTIGPLKLNPPYLKSTIDIILPIQDCAGYMFHIQFHGGRKKLGEIPSVSLPALADLPGYTPPPATSVVSVAFSTTGTPVYSLKPNSGVTLACLPAYFEAYDSYAQRLENEITWVSQEGERVRGLLPSTVTQLESSQEELLKGYGCTCTSPHLELATTDPQVLKRKESSQLGHYHFGGMHGGHPFYLQTPHDHAGSHSHSSHGHSASPGRRPAPSPPSSTMNPPTAEPMYLFYNSAKQQWVIGKTLGTTRGLFFGTTEKSLAKCPGDSTTRGHWQTATSTFGNWKLNTLVTLNCETDL